MSTLLMEPFLYSINYLLMQEEGLEDSTCMQQGGDGSYQTILGSFYDIIGDHPPPESSVVSTNLDDMHIPHQIAEKQVNPMRFNGFNILARQMLMKSGASRETLPANGNLQSSFSQEESANTSLVLPRQARHVVCLSSANCNTLSTTNVRDTWASCSGSGTNAHLQLPSPYKEFSLKLAGVELSFQDLNLHNHYAALYVGKPSIPTAPPKYGDKETALAIAAGKRGKSGKKRTPNRQEYVDLSDLIVKCGQAVVGGDATVANEFLQDIRQVHGASADGNVSQRVAHYFSEALVARMRGTGGKQYRALIHEKQSQATILKSFGLSPVVFLWATHYFANQSILKAAERASRLHVVDFGLEYGLQWAFLINALADQKGGPPLLVITGIGLPQPGNNTAGRLEESGRRLAAHARTYNVPFQYHAIVSSKWEDLDSSSYHFHEDEVLVVNCMMSLRHLANVVEGDDLVSPRQKFLRCIHSLKPHLLITAGVNAAYDSIFFASRFREALYHYSNLFDMFETLWGDRPERLLKERGVYREILNIVACEGAERVERAETYKKWEVRIKRAGFEQLPIPPEVVSRSRWHLKQQYHKEFFVHDDGNKWMLLGWRGRTAMAISAWKLSHAKLHML